jgi:hypothetical protein
VPQATPSDDGIHVARERSLISEPDHSSAPLEKVNMEAKNQMDHPTPQQIDRPYPASDALRREIEILDETPEVTPQPASPEKRKLYLPVKGKFFISTVFACVWISASWYFRTTLACRAGSGCWRDARRRHRVFYCPLTGLSERTYFI